MLTLDDLKRIRKRLGLTQKELAAKAGVSQSLIAKIEAGRLDPAYSKAVQLINTLENISNQEQNALTILNKSIISVSGSHTIKQAIAKMKKDGISQMPVLEERKPVGLVSDAILLESMLKGADSSTLVRDVMDDAPPTLSKEASLSLVSQLLKEYPMVLVSEKGKLLGHITKSDILAKAFK